MYRNRHQFALVLAIVVVALMTAFFGQAVLAQTSTPTAPASQVEIVGKVTDFTGLTITILDQVIDISKAEFYGSFAVGDVVKVKATMNPDGTLTAIEVEPAQAGDNSNDNSAGNTNDNSANNSNDNVGNDNSADNGNDNSVDFEQHFELSGTVTEIGADFMVVSGFRLETAGAQIEGSVAVGATVKAEVSLVNNAYVASKIELTSPGEDHALPTDCVVKAPEGWTTYAVQFGDTLSGIAVGSGAGLSDIVTVNCITNPSSVAVGTILFVPHEPQPLAGNDNGNNNSNDNVGDHGNDNGNNNSNDNIDNHGNDNGGDHSNDNGGNHSNDNGGDHSNDNGGGNDHGGDNSNDNH